jgi:hypothetical protein
LIRRSTGAAAVWRGSRSNTSSLRDTPRERSTKASVTRRSAATFSASITPGTAR